METIDDLELLPGIGYTKASAIVTYRNSHGNFKEIDALFLAPGIGPSIMTQIREIITVGDIIR